MAKQAVLIGAAQWVSRDVDYANTPNPLEALHQVALSAADDAGITPKQLQMLDAIGLVDVGGWSPQNGPDLLAESLGAKPASHIWMGLGGDTPIVLLNRFATDITSGQRDFALLAGTNHLKSLHQATAAKAAVEWPNGGRGKPEVIGVSNWGNSPLEAEYGLGDPTAVYPLFENALRAERGLSLDAHINAVAQLMSPFTRIAASNPYAWFPTERSAKDLATVTPTNRMISYPYPKYLNAVMNTEQSAAVLMCSTDMAKRLGVPEHQWVYWRGGAKARETEWFPSDRPSFTESEAMGLAAKNALANADCLVDEISAFDFYSCFPIAVEIACKQLGIAEDDSRDFTVTGGLPYAGGPASNYSLHGVAAMMQRLRKNNSSSHDSSENANQDHTGLVTGNGWYMTKHAAAVLSTLPPVATNTDIDDIRIAQENQSASMAAIPDHAKATLAADDINATVEAYTVTFDRDGKPSRGIVVGSTEQGQRFVANTADDRDLLESFCAVEQVGTKGKVTSASGKNLFDPH